jgi:urea carboxylase-associated protein 2
MSESTPYWVLWEEHVMAGAHWSGLLRRGVTMRIMDVKGGANVSMLLYNYDDRLERYNMPDTLKAQHTAYLTKDYVCYSDMGRILCSITEDTSGWHDTICGVTNAEMVEKKYGKTRYQEQRNDYYKNGYDSLLNELAKYGLGKRDFGPTINWFSKVVVDDSGAMQFVPEHAKAGAYVDLRFEMNTLVVLTTCQHPLDPNPRYEPREVHLTAWQSRPPARNDPCRMKCPENQRGFRNTEMWMR